jgi:MerR family redox-sensitive transcriptional activator SoxR
MSTTMKRVSEDHEDPPMRSGDPLTVGEVAARSGVAISALHFYESKGLICQHTKCRQPAPVSARCIAAPGGHPGGSAHGLAVVRDCRSVQPASRRQGADRCGLATAFSRMAADLDARSAR